MTDRMPIALRVHTEILAQPSSRKRKTARGSAQNRQKRRIAVPKKWPEHALVIDCETTTDERQALTFGAYRFCRAGADGIYICINEGFFYADNLAELDPDALSTLREYVETHRAETAEGFSDSLCLMSRSEFMERVFWRAAGRAGALVVGFNLPFDLSRLAVDSRVARGQGEGWSLVMFRDIDPKTGQPRENPLRPRIKIKPKDSKSAFIRFAGVSIRSKKTGRRLMPYTPGRFLDLRTLGWALRNKAYSLETAYEDFHVPGKLAHKPTGRVSLEEIDYCRQDVRGTTDLLNAMRAEYDKHPIDLRPERAYSPATIAKAYLTTMKVAPPLQKFSVPPSMSGASMQAYYGGRAECRIRHTIVPVVLTDFLSEYPTVNTLMGLWSLLTAQRLRIADATREVRKFLSSISLDAMFDPKHWKDLAFFALVEPERDILPVRTNYNGRSSNIGVNPLSSDQPVWYAGPDLVAAALLTGRPPRVVRAVRLIPEGRQKELTPVSLHGMVTIDPRKDDFFKRVIEARARVKQDRDLPEAERESLAYFLKILANSGSYGLFVEVNPEKVGADPKTGLPARARLRVFAGEQVFEQSSPMIENGGRWYSPMIAALITSAGRLLLAMLERSVADAGGTYLFCDTDSLAIVANEKGGLAPCIGGPHRLPDGSEAVKALSWDDVRQIVARFERLNPYDRRAVPESILKVEKVNFAADGSQRELLGYAIAAKRYALFTRTADGGIRIEKASAHGLGFLYAPKSGFDRAVGAPVWVVEAWEWILRGVLDLSRVEPSWFELPAMMRITITTSEVFKVLQARQQGSPYSERVKPFNFILSPIIDRLAGNPDGTDPNQFTLIAPYTSDPSRWRLLEWINIHDGNTYRLARPDKRLPHEVQTKTYGDVISRYRWHPEAKSLAPDGGPCSSQTAGLLQRTSVTAAGFKYIGKETDRRWEQGEDFSLIDSPAIEYHPNETARLVTDYVLQHQARQVSIRALARAAGVSTRTVKAARRGKRIRKSTAQKLAVILKSSTLLREFDK